MLHICIYEFSAGMPLARLTTVRLWYVPAFETAAFSIPIPCVVFCCAQEEMVRSRTWRVIAMVTDIEAGRDGSKVKLPGHTMSAGSIDDAISPAASMSRPAPTALRHGHFGPEALLFRHSHGVGCALTATKTRCSLRDVERLGKTLAATLLADKAGRVAIAFLRYAVHVDLLVRFTAPRELMLRWALSCSLIIPESRPRERKVFSKQDQALSTLFFGG